MEDRFNEVRYLIREDNSWYVIAKCYFVVDVEAKERCPFNFILLIPFKRKIILFKSYSIMAVWHLLICLLTIFIFFERFYFHTSESSILFQD